MPEKDEHYRMEFLPDTDAEIIGVSTSEHGEIPALWVKAYGRGRIAAFTPGHTTPILTCPGYVRILKNMIRWCRGEEG